MTETKTIYVTKWHCQRCKYIYCQGKTLTKLGFYSVSCPLKKRYEPKKEARKW